MTLTTEERAKRRFDRAYQKSREYQIGTYISTFVAPVFQQMIRAEAAADTSTAWGSGFGVPAIIRGEIKYEGRHIGECVCVTCGKVGPWKGGLNSQAMDTGHFLPGRRASILFEETNVAPQCKYCNRTGGMPEAFRKWMEVVRGQDEIERLERLKNVTKQWTREELVAKKIEYSDRLKAAVERIG